MLGVGSLGRGRLRSGVLTGGCLPCVGGDHLLAMCSLGRSGRARMRVLTICSALSGWVFLQFGRRARAAPSLCAQAQSGFAQARRPFTIWRVLTVWQACAQRLAIWHLCSAERVCWSWVFLPFRRNVRSRKRVRWSGCSQACLQG